MNKKSTLKLIIFQLFTILPFQVFGQLIVTDPAIPTDNQPVVITFDATQGDKGLIGFTGDVYAHTGVITDKSTANSDWKYVKAAWTTNLPECKLTRIETNKYQLSITPSIRAFYGVPASEKILKMAFVFRNSSGTITGRAADHADIFTDVYTQGLNVSFINPSVPFTLANDNQEIPISVQATANDSICLFLDDVKIKSAMGQSLSDTVYASGSSLHTLISVAYKGTESAADTVTYLVPGNTMDATIPHGTHDGINYINDSTVTFVLFAPYKKYIYLIGDFNNWTPDNKFLMYRGSNDTTRFWFTINNLEKSKEYIFQYLIDGNIRIADPYCEKISDPWNDKYIPSSVYPNLIPYPDGKTTDIAGVIQTAQTPYNWQVTSFTPPAKNNLVVYELLIRDFTANKDIKTVTDTINYLKRLGVNAIELMPFSEFDGNDSWGYNPDFYFAPDKAYGTRDDYKKFIDVCHQNGIAVIQDMVLDFSTGNSPLVRMYSNNGDPSAQNPWYNVSAPAGAYTFGGYDFNHESIYTRKLTDSITSFWMKEYKIDGFRFDFAKGWTNTPGEGTPYDQSRINNLELAANHIWQQNPNAYVILELFTANTEETVLANDGMLIWGNLNYAYGQASMGFSTGWDFSGISYKNLGWNNPGLMGYMESHDEEREMYRNVTFGNAGGVYNIKDTTTALKRMELDYTFFLPVPGPKMMWQFGEIGYDISIDSMGRVGDKPVKWGYYNDPRRKHLYDIVSALIHLKQDEPVFSTTDFTLQTSAAAKHIELKSNDTIVEIIGNFDVYGNSYSLTFPESGQWFEFFTGDTLNLSNTTYQFSLKPGEYKLYSNRRLKGTGSFPNLPTRAEQLNSADKVKIYPNPCTEYAFVDSPSGTSGVSVYSVTGSLITKLSSEGKTLLVTQNLPAGVYYVKISYKSGEYKIVKLIKK